MKIFYEKKALKGVGAMHPLLTSAAYICECEHSHLHASLFSARQGRATPFKEKKSSFIGARKRQSQKKAIRIVIFINQEFEN